MAFNIMRSLIDRGEKRTSRHKHISPPRLPAHVIATKPTARRRLQILSDADIQFFMTYGYLKIPGCFGRFQCERLMGDLWQRMGVSPDKGTWHNERIDVPGREEYSIRQFAPKAWAAICDLLGGEERLEEGSDEWDDSFIVNLGKPEGEGKYIEPDGWHVDGDFFAHFLDSPEQALLVLPLFTDIRPGGGGTALCPAAIPEIARYLYEHPEGVSPDLVPRAEDPNWNRKPQWWRIGEIVERLSRNSFVEATGNAGDVYFLHPLMAHSASNNMHRDLRVINNPNVQLRRPFNFDRAEFGDYSVVELATLHQLERERLPGWTVTGSRDRISPAQRKWGREEEFERLRETKPRFIGSGYVTS